MLRPRTILVLFSLLGALTACSRLSLTYNFADWIVYWKIDKYFDVSSQQKPLLNSRLAHFHSWHRQKEIPHYVRFFRTLLYYWSHHDGREENSQMQFEAMGGEKGLAKAKGKLFSSRLAQSTD